MPPHKNPTCRILLTGCAYRANQQCITHKTEGNLYPITNPIVTFQCHCPPKCRSNQNFSYLCYYFSQQIFPVNTEAKLLTRLSQGEKNAFEEVFRRYYGKVFRFIRAILHGHGIAEDLTQNVFLKLWSSRRSLAEIRSLDAFLFTVARNETCDYLRRKQTGLKYRVAELERQNRGYDMPYSCDTERIERIIAETIDQMPAQRQLVYKLSREEHLSNPEIAERLNLSKRTVERHLSLALNDIRQAIAPLVSGLTLFFFSHWV